VNQPKLRLVYGYKPHECIILGLDPATKTGWSIFVNGEYEDSGVARNLQQRCEVLEKLRAIALNEELPVVVVAEDWTPGDWKSWKAISGIFESWGRWDEQLNLTGFTDIVRVLVQTWRSDIFGRGAKRMNRKTAKAMARARVKSVYHLNVSSDEAEAILIGEWGCRAGEVGELLAA
jgi:hypothetical protein